MFSCLVYTYNQLKVLPSFSPHIRSIRERITLGSSGEAVPGKSLDSHFHKIKDELDIAIEREKGHLSQFEVCSWMDIFCYYLT